MASASATGGTEYARYSSHWLASITRNDHAVAAACLAVALIYATLRYNIFKHVPWADWPTYVVNKALGLSSLMLLALTVKRGSSGKATGKALMLWSGILAGTHVVLSLILLKPDYYPKFFDGSKFTAIAAYSMLFGAIALAVQELGARTAKNWSLLARQQGFGLFAVMTGLHAALPGVAGWFTPATWPGGLPPITLISATIAGLAMYWAALNARTQGFTQPPPHSPFRIVGH